MTNIVKVVPYNIEWPQMFEKEAQLIKSALGDNCIRVHHIGSTAVPKLAAKPIIDILPVVKDILCVDQSVTAMENLHYRSLGEHGIPFRRFFTKEQTFHVHVYEQENSEIERHLKFRDWMRTHECDRELYAELKTRLALKFANDRAQYISGKEQFVATIDNKAGFNQLRLRLPLTSSEWQTVRYLRQTYFFDRVHIDDPYTWTFQDATHIHFVFYLGTTIIGYAHIQLWPENRAALRIIVIEESHRNLGFGSELLRLSERWLTQQNIKELLVQSSPEAYQFYCQHNYVAMPFNDPDGYETDPRDIEIGKYL